MGALNATRSKNVTEGVVILLGRSGLNACNSQMSKRGGESGYARLSMMEGKTKEKYKTYFGRYYVLAAIALLSAQQNVSWATFSPIAVEAWQAYGLTAIEVTLLPGIIILYLCRLCLNASIKSY